MLAWKSKFFVSLCKLSVSVTKPVLNSNWTFTMTYQASTVPFCIALSFGPTGAHGIGVDERSANQEQHDTRRRIPALCDDVQAADYRAEPRVLFSLVRVHRSCTELGPSLTVATRKES